MYVLDVSRWDRLGAILSGDYIDLVAIAPPGANRPRRQTGGVLYAPGLGPDHDDVSRFVVAQFTIAFPWGETGQTWDAGYLFPHPGEDIIYHQLLTAPFFKTVRPQADGGEETVWRRSFTIPEYYLDPADLSRRQLYRGFDRALKPTLYYPWLMRNLDRLQTNQAWQANLRTAFERAVPILLDPPHILFSLQRGGPYLPPDQPPAQLPAPFQNFFLEFSPESFGVGYDESRMTRGFWLCWLNPHEFVMQSFGTADGNPRASEVSRFSWQPGKGLVAANDSGIRGSLLTLPLDLIRLTVEGALILRPPDPHNSNYSALTTTDRLWSILPGWSDLL